MSLYDEAMKHVPEYYPSMYMDGYSPEEILYAKRRQILENIDDPEDPDDTINFICEVKIK